MNTETKKLLDEMILFKKTKLKPDKLLNKAYMEIDNIELISLIGFLLIWPKQVLLGVAFKEKMEIDKQLFESYSNLFEKCPLFKTIYTISQDNIGWNSILSEQEKDAISAYIHQNYKAQLRLRKNIK